MTTYHYTYDSPVGKLRLQASDQHLQAILFANEGDALLNTAVNPVLENCINQLSSYFSGQRKKFDLPLLQTGTTFQKKIWDLLVKIPYGKTITYNDLSRQYGEVKAIRAVASANGKNNLPIIVPCHRVIGSNQSLTGYSGGLRRKKWLLEHEAKFGAGLQMLDF